VNGLERVLRRAAEELDGAAVGWALVGGLAVSARAEPRFTRDVDLAVSVADDETAEAIVRAQRERGYAFVAGVEHEPSGRLATVRLRPPLEPQGGIVLDLLFASSGIEPEIVVRADRLALTRGLELAVAQTGHLIAMKLLADDPGRPQDRGDIAALIGAATPADLELAREAVDLITARGFDRGRDLRAALAQAVA